MKTIIFEKLQPYSKLWKYEDFRKHIIKYSGSLDPENCEIDLKIHLFEKVGEVPCRPIWHYDGTNSPSTDSLWKYSLFLTGDCISRTLFFKNEPDWFDGSEKDIHKYASGLQKQGEPTRSLDYEKFTDYTNKNLHTGVNSENTGTRILIRLKEII